MSRMSFGSQDLLTPVFLHAAELLIRACERGAVSTALWSVSSAAVARPVTIRRPAQLRLTLGGKCRRGARGLRSDPPRRRKPEGAEENRREPKDTEGPTYVARDLFLFLGPLTVSFGLGELI